MKRLNLFLLSLNITNLILYLAVFIVSLLTFLSTVSWKSSPTFLHYLPTSTALSSLLVISMSRWTCPKPLTLLPFHLWFPSLIFLLSFPAGGGYLLIPDTYDSYYRGGWVSEEEKNSYYQQADPSYYPIYISLLQPLNRGKEVWSLIHQFFCLIRSLLFMKS